MVNETKEAVGSQRKDRLNKGGSEEQAEARSRGFPRGAGGAYTTADLSRFYKK